jgi:hypothetical protein
MTELQILRRSIGRFLKGIPPRKVLNARRYSTDSRRAPWAFLSCGEQVARRSWTNNHRYVVAAGITVGFGTAMSHMQEKRSDMEYEESSGETHGLVLSQLSDRDKHACATILWCYRLVGLWRRHCDHMRECKKRHSGFK